MGMQAHAALETLTLQQVYLNLTMNLQGPLQFQDNPLYAAMQITGLPANKIKVNIHTWEAVLVGKVKLI